MSNFIESSKQNWASGDTIEHINAGSLQRIACATEAMAKNYVQIQNDLNWYKEHYRQRCVEIETLNKRIASFKGVITKLKKQVL